MCKIEVNETRFYDRKALAGLGRMLELSEGKLKESNLEWLEQPDINLPSLNPLSSSSGPSAKRWMGRMKANGQE